MPAAVGRPGPAGAGRRFRRLVLLAGVAQAFVVVAVVHRHHDALGQAHGAVYVDPAAHWLRDSVLYAPAGVVLLLLATLAARRLVTRWRGPSDGLGACLLWAGLAGTVYALATVPAAAIHGLLLSSGHAAAPSMLRLTQEAVVTLRYSFALLIAVAMVCGLPWAPRRRLTFRRAPSVPSVPSATTSRSDLC